MFAIRKKTVQALVLLVVTATAMVRCTSSNETVPDKKPEASTAADAVSVERGQYLVSVSGCNDCHSPKIFSKTGFTLDSSRLLSGHPAGSPLPAVNVAALQPGGWLNFTPDLTAVVGPWGLTYSANITSDSATGIGAWTEANFLNAVRKGRHMGLDDGRPIMPPMPWEAVGRMSEADLKSIFAYLKSTPAVSNRVHDPLTPPEVQALAKAKS